MAVAKMTKETKTFPIIINISTITIISMCTHSVVDSPHENTDERFIRAEQLLLLLLELLFPRLEVLLVDIFGHSHYSSGHRRLVNFGQKQSPLGAECVHSSQGN